jgi:hypothetical protein
MTGLSSGKESHHSGKGSSQGLMLNLMVDHSLLFRPAQLARIENKLPAYTVGSLTDNWYICIHQKSTWLPGILASLRQPLL